MPHRSDAAPSENPPGEKAALSDIVRERSAYVQDADGGLPASSDEACPPDDERETTEPCLFTVVRRADESGVSGTGRVLDGCIFHSGQVVICWRGDINSEKSGYSSLAIYPCWEAFHKVHIESHPSNETEIVFGQEPGLMTGLIERAAEHDADDAEHDADS